ncbi:MAG: hypothetical protein QNJ60_02970 [Xenococcaceae cyanobacterium MO_188.B19]|nr:hypothetical protein [Xenococcaceae cyanobacterium MO_188.B19]
MLYSKNLLAIKSLGLGTILLGLAQTPAMGFSLDLFTSFQTSDFQDVTLSGNSSAGTSRTDQDQNLDTTVFGGKRRITITKTSSQRVRGTNELILGCDLDLGCVSGTAAINVAANVIINSEILWDGNDTSNTPTDFTIDGGVVQQGIVINIESLNLGTGDGDITLNFELRDTSDNVATLSQTITSNIASPTNIDFRYFNRIESTSDAGGDIDLTNIDYARFYTSDENVSDDFIFNYIQTDVPFNFSPGLGLIISIGVFGFLGFRNSKTDKSENC